MATQPKEIATVIVGAGLGAGLMYLLDPRRGKRRRHVLRDKTYHLWRVAESELGKSVRDARNRTKGLAARVRGLRRQVLTDDDVLIARAWSAVGRVVSHPRALEITCHQGRVRVLGDILAEELPFALKILSQIRGVISLEDSLICHASADTIPRLRGGHTQHHVAETLLRNPSRRLLAGGLGLASLTILRARPLWLAASLLSLGLLVEGGTQRRQLQAGGVSHPQIQAKRREGSNLRASA